MTKEVKVKDTTYILEDNEAALVESIKDLTRSIRENK